MLVISGLIVLLVAGVVLWLVYNEIKKKNMNLWLGSYLSRKPEEINTTGPVHIMFAFCDHFEPGWANGDLAAETRRVDRWCTDYPALAFRHKDADGCHPKHSFFYPEEEYRFEHLDKIAKLCKQGLGEVEIHLHHDNDTPSAFSKKMNGFLHILDSNHGLIPRDTTTNQYCFSFIHGNWALDNSRRDGRCCGIDNELKLLSDLGCYADFTLPSAPSDTQTSKINSIYYATGVDGKSKSHDSGVDVEAGKKGVGDLMIIQGPLCLNWRNRKYGILPRIENSDIRASSPPSDHRVDLWVNCAIAVKKQPHWRFIKIHTHGTQEMDMDTLLGKPTDEMFTYLETRYNDGKNYVLHYVTAREMYNIVAAAEAGQTGNPNAYRDYRIPRPPVLGTGTDN